MRWDRLLGAIAHPFTEYQVTKAKNKHREKNPCCSVCMRRRDPVTGKQNDVHHRIPVHVRPDMATDELNLMTLCRLHHFLVGHKADWKDYNKLVIPEAKALASKYSDIIGIRRWLHG